MEECSSDEETKIDGLMEVGWDDMLVLAPWIRRWVVSRIFSRISFPIEKCIVYTYIIYAYLEKVSTGYIYDHICT